MTKLAFVSASFLALISACKVGATLGAGGSSGGNGTYPGFEGAGAGGPEALANATMTCYYGSGSTPIAALEEVLEVDNQMDLVHVRLTLDPNFVDNTYGTNAIGWSNSNAPAPPPPPGGMGGMGPSPGGHTFDDLDASDHDEIVFNGGAVLDVMQDYISADNTAPSGYATLGVNGGDGKVVSGDGTAVVSASSSLDRNFNERGYSSFVVNSPSTDDHWSPSPDAPNWDFRVVYEIWVTQAAVGANPNVSVGYVHASPSKSNATVTVTSNPCPPNWGCQNSEGCGGGSTSSNSGSNPIIQ